MILLALIKFLNWCIVLVQKNLTIWTLYIILLTTATQVPKLTFESDTTAIFWKSFLIIFEMKIVISITFEKSDMK